MNSHHSDLIRLPEGPFAAYIFDCDGTLADSMPHHYGAWATAFRQHGANFDFTWELFYSMAGVGLHDSVEQLNQRFGDRLDPEAVVQTQAQLHRAGVEAIKPIEPVVNLARQLARQTPVAVASGGDRIQVHGTLRAIGMENLFPVVVTIDDVSRGKPAPDLFLLAAERLGVEPTRCLVFEDSQLGLQAAEAAGMQWVYIEPGPYRPLGEMSIPNPTLH